jgi:hypothetical protein
LSNYVTQDQYDYLENIVNNLDIEADLSNYYTIPETDGLLDLKQDALTSANAGAGIEIIDGVISMTGDVAPGKDGREVVLRNTGDYIQWQYYGDATWNNLVALDDLAGADGRDVDMRVVGNVVQWQLAGDATWKNLLDLSTLPGGMEIAGTPGNLMMFDETDGTGIEDTGIAADKILVMPDADDLNRGDGDYTIVVSKAGGDVSGPAYMKVY